MSSYVPSPRQYIAHTCQADELLFGGAAGGGKSHYLRHEALRTITRFPGANVVYFRRKNSELEETIGRSRPLCMPAGGRYAGGHLMQWKFPDLVDATTGRTSTWKFSHLNQESDKYRHQSNEFDLIIFDEASTFTHTMIDFMRSRSRTPIPGSPARIRMGTNPGGISHVYFKERFQIPDHPDAPREERPDLVQEVLHYWPIDESEALWQEIIAQHDMTRRDEQEQAKRLWLKRSKDEGIFWRAYDRETRYSKKVIDPYDVWRPIPTSEDDLEPGTRCFIPALIDDNPVYAVDNKYRSSLATLGDETLTRALLHGDWSVFEGQFFKEWDPKLHVIDPIIPPAHWPTWGSMDWGMAAYGVFQWHTINPETEQVITYREYRYRETPIPEVARNIVAMTTEAEHLIKVLADPAVFKRQGSIDTEAMIPKACAREGLHLEPADNTRVAGWSVCRSMLALNPATGEPHWVVTSNCQGLINSIPYMVHDDNNVEDIADHDDDHDCFVAGTLIETEYGPRPIETITAGERVVTRQGLKPVVVATLSSPHAQVYTARLSNGRQITGTGNHPIWIPHRGWVPLDSLRYGDILLPCDAKLLSSMESNTDATLTHPTGQRVPTSSRMAQLVNVVSGDSIRRFGKRTTDPSPRAITSITKTRTRSTTTSKILSASPTEITPSIIPALGTRAFWHVFAHWRPNGTSLPQDVHGIASTPKRSGRSTNQLRRHVNSVAQRLRTVPSNVVRGSAPILASPNGGVMPGWTMWNAVAKSAAPPLRPTGTTRPAPVAVHVLSVSVHSTPEPVYNLTVADAHEYFAEGVLVHNCDAWRYGLSRRPSLGGAVRRSKVKAGRIRPTWLRGR